MRFFVGFVCFLFALAALAGGGLLSNPNAWALFSGGAFTFGTFIGKWQVER